MNAISGRKDRLPSGRTRVAIGDPPSGMIRHPPLRGDLVEVGPPRHPDVRGGGSGPMGAASVRRPSRRRPCGKRPDSRAEAVRRPVKERDHGSRGVRDVRRPNTTPSRGRDGVHERPERDLNPRITDLQSVPLGHLGIRPWLRSASWQTAPPASIAIGRSWRRVERGWCGRRVDGAVLRVARATTAAPRSPIPNPDPIRRELTSGNSGEGPRREPTHSNGARRRRAARPALVPDNLLVQPRRHRPRTPET